MLRTAEDSNGNYNCFDADFTDKTDYSDTTLPNGEVNICSWASNYFLGNSTYDSKSRTAPSTRLEPVE